MIAPSADGYQCVELRSEFFFTRCPVPPTDNQIVAGDENREGLAKDLIRGPQLVGVTPQHSIW